MTLKKAKRVAKQQTLSNYKFILQGVLNAFYCINCSKRVVRKMCRVAIIKHDCGNSVLNIRKRVLRTFFMYVLRGFSLVFIENGIGAGS